MNSGSVALIELLWKTIRPMTRNSVLKGLSVRTLVQFNFNFAPSEIKLDEKTEK